MNRSDWPISCVSDEIVAFGSDSVIYLKRLEFARVVRVSVEIVVEGFEYLQNTGSQVILLKR